MVISKKILRNIFLNGAKRNQNYFPRINLAVCARVRPRLRSKGNIEKTRARADARGRARATAVRRRTSVCARVPSQYFSFNNFTPGATTVFLSINRGT